MVSEIKYTRINSKRRSLALQILHDGSIVVKAPFMSSDKMIDQFVNQHREWIEKRLNKVQERNKIPKHTYTTGDIFLYLGSEIILEIGEYTKVEVKDGKLLFPKLLVFRIKKEIEEFYIREARSLITSQTEKFALEMSTKFKEITFSDTKSQWGRCTHDNRLQFSWRLIMAPLLTLNYVVIHELAHTTEKNHSRAFWSKVRNFNPSYIQQIKWLKENGLRLTI